MDMTLDEARRLADDIWDSIPELMYTAVRVWGVANGKGFFSVNVRARHKNIDRVRTYALLTGLPVSETTHIYTDTYEMDLG